jgi:hypothetical protein
MKSEYAMLRAVVRVVEKLLKTDISTIAMTTHRMTFFAMSLTEFGLSAGKRPARAG